MDTSSVDQQDVQWNEEFQIQIVGLDDPAMRIAMPLVSEHNGVPRCIGTGFMVAPGLAITAQHVVADWIEYQEKTDGYKRTGATFSVAGYQWYDGKILQWVADALYASVSADIAFIRFVRPGWWGTEPGQLLPPFARLNLNPPVEGDAVRMVGFPSSEIRDQVLRVAPAVCNGRVVRVDLKTNIRYRPLSHFDVEGELVGGMSGGPCIDSNGNVIGVNSRGWDGVQLAHIAMLWPAMAVEIDLFKTGPFAVVDLFKSGPTRALGYKRVYVTSNGESQLAKNDPESLQKTGVIGTTELLTGVMEFAGSEAAQALADLRSHLTDNFEANRSPNADQVGRFLKHFFWELEATVNLAVVIASRIAALEDVEALTWQQLLERWQKLASPKLRDRLVESISVGTA